MYVRNDLPARANRSYHLSHGCDISDVVTRKQKGRRRRAALGPGTGLGHDFSDTETDKVTNITQSRNQDGVIVWGVPTNRGGRCDRCARAPIVLYLPIVNVGIGMAYRA
ncbi:hypothetical protein EVAR_50294_1 [Eumeta japonica]|uniref:Uncharacterized protein n=1 Tax=Eumeta variegata TaxID=151549 RepID=A0A4C1XUY1_EUMVA|nr:hypothetical protein EVAR_50294_1 [Eumeta japonica]